MAKVVWTVDNKGKLFVDGEKVDESDDWREVREAELKKPPTDIRIEALNEGGPACVWLYVTENGKVIEKTDESWTWDGNKVYVERDKDFIRDTWTPVADTFLNRGAYPIWFSKAGLRKGARVGQWITFKWSKPLLERPTVQAGLGVVGVTVATGIIGRWLGWW